MNEKFNNVAFETLTEKEQNEISGGIILLLLTAISMAEFALVGTAIYGAYQMGYDKACGC